MTAADDDHERDATPDAPAGAPVERRSGHRADGSRPRTRHPSHGPGKGPASGYRWAPFEPGNAVTMTHGGYAPRHVEPLAAELVEAALAVAPYLADAAFAGELAAWSRAEARVALLERWLGEHGTIDEDGNPRPAAEFLAKCERLAAERRHALGLTPMARARLGRDVTAARLDLAREWAQVDDLDGDEPEPDEED